MESPVHPPADEPLQCLPLPPGILPDAQALQAPHTGSSETLQPAVPPSFRLHERSLLIQKYALSS